EFGDVAAKFIKALDAPGAHQACEAALRNAVIVFQTLTPHSGVKQAERMLEYRRELIAGLQHIDRLIFHQRLQTLRQRRLTAANRTEQVDNLLALFQSLRGVTEEGDDPLDRLLHAVEFRESRVEPHRAVHEDAAKTRVLRRVDHLWLTYGGEQALMRARVRHRIVAAQAEEVLQRHFRFSTLLKRASVTAKKIFRHRASVRVSPTLHKNSGPETLNKKPCKSGGDKVRFVTPRTIRPNNTHRMT